MNISYRAILLVFSLLSCQWLIAQVWPGDISDNGRVDGIDWLYLGISFGETGPERIEMSSIWASHNQPDPWSTTFPEGHNISFADCNGDGKVDQLDAEVIRTNFGLQRPDGVVPEALSPGIAGSAPSIFLGGKRLDTIEVVNGTTLSIPISLGTSEIPVETYYGLRFKLQVPDSLTDAALNITAIEDAWIGSNLTIGNTFLNEEEGIDFGMTRTDGRNVGGSGQILDVSIVMEENLVFLQGQPQVFPVIIDSLRLVDKDLNLLSVVGDTLMIKVFPDSANQVSDIDTPRNIPLPLIKLFPNPAKGGTLLQLRSTVPFPGGQWTLINVQGETIIRRELQNWPGRQNSFPLPDLAPGLYFLRAQTKFGSITHKLVIF